MTRSFIMNGFDGVLTALGLVIGTFFLYIGGATINRNSLIIPGLATTLAIGLSGGIGAYLAETAERRKLSLDVKRDMLQEFPSEHPVILKEEDYYEPIELDNASSELNQVEEFDIVELEPPPVKKHQSVETAADDDVEKSIKEKAESFASIVLALVDGISPAFGSIIGLFIFFFVDPNLATFIISFLLESIFLFGLGAYLAKISHKSVVKYGLQMVMAGILTALISFFIGGQTMSQKEKKLKKLYERWTLYSKITDLGEIARRYFVNNFFDGVLTVLGIIIGYFVLFINGTVTDSRSILVPAISVAVAIGISGITGGYLAEKAERDAEFIQIRRAMAMQTEIKRNLSEKKESYYPKVEFKESKIEIADNINVEPIPVESQIKKEVDLNVEPDRTITEDALVFATNIASLINGVAPAVGGLVGVIPFFFITVPSLGTYIAFFILNAVVLFLLGAYLSYISEDSVWKYGTIMVLTGVVTAVLSILLGV